MKTRLLPCTLACMLMTAMPGFSGPEDDFYEANLTLTRAGRLEKEGDFKGALESSKKAARLLQALKQSFPDWNPSWIASKLENASQIRERVELRAMPRDCKCRRNSARLPMSTREGSASPSPRNRENSSRVCLTETW